MGFRILENDNATIAGLNIHKISLNKENNSSKKEKHTTLQDKPSHSKTNNHNAQNIHNNKTQPHYVNNEWNEEQFHSLIGRTSLGIPIYATIAQNHVPDLERRGRE